LARPGPGRAALALLVMLKDPIADDGLLPQPSPVLTE
jgi:hypothetical protein